MVKEKHCKDCLLKKQYEFLKTFDDSLPYTDYKNDSKHVRVFDENAPSYLFKWHTDEEDRMIKILDENDWLFQYDNELPFPLPKNNTISIPKGLYHRIIKGTTEFSIEII